MGASSVFGPAAAAGGAAAAGVAGGGATGGGAGAGAVGTGKSLMDPSGYSQNTNSIASGLRSTRESDWRSREPPDSTGHRLGSMPATDGSQVTVKMSDLKNGISTAADGSVLLKVSERGSEKLVSVDSATYERMSSAFAVSKRSWDSSYSKWRDEGEYSGFVAGYDGIGQKAARRTEF